MNALDYFRLMLALISAVAFILCALMYRQIRKEQRSRELEKYLPDYLKDKTIADFMNECLRKEIEKIRKST